MRLEFTKMQGCGNDYIYIDCFKQKINGIEKYVKALSNRRFGVGGDGVILICPSDTADAKMQMFNSDGSQGNMCGNGIRCVGKFLRDEGYVTADEIGVETKSGIKTLKFVKYGEDTVLKVDMGKPCLNSASLNANTKQDKIINYEVDVNGRKLNITGVSMGNPHCVIFCDNLDEADLDGIGGYFQTSGFFKDGVNVEFVEVVDENKINMRVYERGSKETLACGTGACAAVVASVLNGYSKKNRKVEVATKGGVLGVEYTDNGVYLCGDAKTVFKGYMDLQTKKDNQNKDEVIQ